MKFSGSERVIRGGGWNDSAYFARVSNRFWRPPGYRSGALGFRMVRGIR